MPCWALPDRGALSIETPAAAAVVVSLATPVCADDSGNPFEITAESRARHSAENYDWYQKHGTPLGGYQSPLGDPAPRGTFRPGYAELDANGRYYGYGGTPSRRYGCGLD